MTKCLLVLIIGIIMTSIVIATPIVNLNKTTSQVTYVTNAIPTVKLYANTTGGGTTSNLSNLSEYVKKTGDTMTGNLIMSNIANDNYANITLYWNAGTGKFEGISRVATGAVRGPAVMGDYFLPVENATTNIGSTTLKFSNLFLSGTASVSKVDALGDESRFMNISLYDRAGIILQATETLIYFVSLDPTLTGGSNTGMLFDFGNNWISLFTYLNEDLAHVNTVGNLWNKGTTNSSGLILRGGNITDEKGTIQINNRLKVINDTEIGDCSLFVNATTGRVGIGTCTPTSFLQVVGGGVFSSGIQVGYGTYAVPSYDFSSDANTGMWRNQSDAMCFSTGGTSRMCIAGEFGNPNTRVEIGGTDSNSTQGLNNALTVWGNTAIIGNINTTGNITGNTHHAGMFASSEGGFSGMEWNNTYKIVNFTTSTHSNGFKFIENNKLSLTNSNAKGEYQVIWHLEETGTNNHIYYGKVFVNNVEQNSTLDRAVGQASNSFRLTGFGFININNLNDNVTLRVRDVGSTSIPTAYIKNLNIVRVENIN
jgi:hypothetical protein